MKVLAQEVLDKYRDINVGHDDWFEYLYDEFKSDLRKVGIDVEDIYFSGFWSQGDGASFTGRIRKWDIALFLEAHFKPTEYPMLKMFIDKGGEAMVRISQSGHYYHSNTMGYSYEFESFSDVMDRTSEFISQIIDNFDEELSVELVEFQDNVEHICKDYADEFYKTLEKEYDYQTSDEAVTEAVISNELDKFEE